ncbi:MAG: hypothetical protein VB862_11975 [Pirellulaceae bacterium]
MKTHNSSILRSWTATLLTSLLTSLLTIGLVLPNSGCRLGHSGDHPAVGWRDWLPRSHRGLVRARLAPRQGTPVTSSEEIVATNSAPLSTLRTIAPLPPKTDSQTLPMAPMPADDVPELVAIENDLPELEAIPTESLITKEDTAKNAPAPLEVPAEEVPAEEVPAEEVPAEEVPAEEVPAATTTLPVPAIPIVKQAIDPAAPLEPELAPLLPKTALSSTPTEEDMQIAREILKNFKGLKEAGYLHHFSIYLRVINGTAELSGELISDVQHNLLTRTVRSVAGVQAVKDLLVVKALDVEPNPQPAIPAIDEPILESPQPQPVAAPQAERPALAEKAPVEAAPVEEAPAATEESKVEEEPQVEEESNLEVPADTSKAPIELPNPVEEDLFKIK